MTSSYPARWYDPHAPAVDRPEDHPQLLAWEREQDALRAPVVVCACFVDDGRGGCEYEPAGCPVHAATLGTAASE